MTGGQTVPKKMLIEQIRRTVINGTSGFFTILTDKKRSIMFRFSEGKLIHSHCRGRKVEDAIAAFHECDELTFNYSASQPKDQPELMAAEAFLLAISPDEVVDKAVVKHNLLEPVDATGSGAERPVNPELESQVCDIARDYIGMVASILVRDVFAKRLSANQTVDEIAASIPIPEHATLFRERVGALDLELKEVVEEAAEEVKKSEPEHRLFF